MESERSALFKSGHLATCCRALQKKDVECVKLLVPLPHLQGVALKKSIAAAVIALTAQLAQVVDTSAHSVSRMGILAKCASRMAEHSEALRGLAGDRLWEGVPEVTPLKKNQVSQRAKQLQRDQDSDVLQGAAKALPLYLIAFETRDSQYKCAHPLPSADLRLV
jgi:hypothetical protein